MCHGSKLINSLGEQQHELFHLHMVKSCFLKPWQICEPAGIKQSVSSQLFSSFELGGITKHIMTGSTGNSEFSFPSNLNVETKLAVSLGVSH